jgi:hypothetical protein
MTGEGSTLDPRFDPVFQRGYQGGLRDSAPPARSVEPQQVAPPAIEPEPVATPTRGRVDTADERYLPVVMTEPAGERSEPRRLINPFIVLLWIVGPALVIGGVVSVQETFVQQWSNNFSPEDTARLQTIMIAAQAAVTVGFAIVGGLLFWHAAAWQRARATRRQAPSQ